MKDEWNILDGSFQTPALLASGRACLVGESNGTALFTNSPTEICLVISLSAFKRVPTKTQTWLS
jgi:hypothetical protein